MLADIALHFALDMSGAATLWCILRGCSNPDHQHRAVVRFMGRHPWLMQCPFALLLAYSTVRWVDL